MKMYGIAKEYWGGECYNCDYNEDIELYFNKKIRDERLEEYKNKKNIGDIIYNAFEIETEDKLIL